MSEEMKVGLRQAGREFVPAFKSSWPYTLIGLLAGFVLLACATYLTSQEIIKHDNLVYLLLEHVGLGFIVSAVAVLFYEWGAHQKKVLEHGRRLAEIQAQLTELTLTQGLKALERGLKEVLPSQCNDIKLHIVSIIKAVADLERKNIWASKAYTECLAKVLFAVKENAESLSKLDVPGDYSYSASSATTADAILALQMRELQQGDKYDVISHLSSWIDHRLDELQKAQHEVQTRGVEVRRIFNLDDFTASIPRDIVRKILIDHVEEADKQRGYTVKVLLPSDHFSLESAPREMIGNAQVAIFRCGSHCVRVRVIRRDLSKLLIGTSGDQVRTDLALFNSVWDAGRKLTRDLVEECLRQIYHTPPALLPSG